MLANQLLDTPLVITQGMSDDELKAEWNAMIQRATMTQKLIDGAIDWEAYFDFMAQQGYEPTELMDTAEENLDLSIKEGWHIER